MPDISRIEKFNGEDAETWIEQLMLMFSGNNIRVPKSENSHIFMSTIICKSSKSVKKFMRSQGSVIQKMLAKVDAIELDVEIIIDVLVDEYPADDEDDVNPDPHAELFALSQKKYECLKEYMGRAKRILKDMVAKDTTNQSKAMSFSLQIVIKAFVNGLDDRKLADKIIEEERKIHYGTLAEARMTIQDVEEYMKMVSELKERQLQASKAAAFEAKRKMPGQNVK